MTGIAGVVPGMGENCAVRHLQTMTGALKINEDEILQEKASPQVGLVGAARPGQMALFEAGAVTLAWIGQFAADALTGEFAPPTASTGEGIIQRYLQAGAEALCGLNGRYALALWDADHRRLVIANDRLGLQPLYFWHNGAALAFASKLKALAGCPLLRKSLDPTALFDLLATGQMLGEHTLLQDVQALPPASLLLYEAGRLQVKTYWQPRLYQTGEPHPPPEDLAEPLVGLLRQAVERRLRPPISLLLTGGLDSRLLAGVLAGQPAGAVFANTIGHERAADVILARRVAQAAGLDHVLIPVNPHYLEEYSGPCVRRTEGHMNCYAAWILGERELPRWRQAASLMTGVGGEAVSGRHVLAERAGPDLTAALRLLTGAHWKFHKAARLLRAPFGRAAAQQSFALLAECALHAPSTDPYSRYDYLHLHQMRRHPTGNILQDEVEVVEPFFDNDLLDFALTIPPRARTAAYTLALRRFFPRLAAIHTTETGRLVGKGRAKPPGRRSWQSLWRSLRRRVAPSAASLSDPVDHIIYPNRWLRTHARPLVERAMGELDLLGEWLDVAAVRRLADDHLEGRRNEYKALCAVITALLTVQLLFESD